MARGRLSATAVNSRTTFRGRVRGRTRKAITATIFGGKQ